MLGLKLVNSSIHLDDDGPEGNLEFLSAHCVRSLCIFCQPWADIPRRVCGDSFFASLYAGEALLRLGIYFSSVMKISSRRYPVQYLNEQNTANRGDSILLASEIVVNGVKKKAYLFVGETGSVDFT